jgi:PAS domain S-box-containing protein
MTRSEAPDLLRLQQRLAEAEETLRAIREGEVDAVVVSGPSGDAIYTLQGAETPYRVLVERMGEGAATISPGGTLLYCNRRFAEMLGLPLETIPGTSLASHLEGKAEAIVRAMQEAGQGVSIEAELRGAEGPVPVQLTFGRMPPLEGSQPLAVVIATDLTRLKQTESAVRLGAEELRVRAEQLRSLVLELSQTEQRERKRLAQILHDEFQQLLVAAQLQLERLDPHVQPRGREPVNHLRDLLRDSLRASREVTLELSPPILHQAGLMPALRWLAGWFEKKHGLPVRVMGEEKLRGMSEPARLFLFSATRELLLNVLKHAGAKTCIIKLEHTGEGQAVLAVEDDGVGMPAHGGPFPPSDGLGLFSIRERLEMIGGRMDIRPAALGGTRVALEVPLAQEAPPEAGPEATYLSGAPVIPAGADEAIRVLLADDHAMVRQGLGALLRGQPGIRVVGEAANGAEAISLAQRVHPDVILMDVNMPVMDGVEATRHIASRWPDIVIIGLSMHAGDDMLESMRRAGAAAYITKDKAAATLCGEVRKAFARRHPGSPSLHPRAEDLPSVSGG